MEHPGGLELVISGPGLPARRVTLGDVPLVIGRNPGLDVVLDHRAVSRQHARVSRRGGAVWIESLSDKQPVTVDGRPVTSGPLVPGASAAIGPYELRVAGPHAPQVPPEVLRGQLEILRALVEGFDLRRPPRAYLDDLMDVLIRGVGAERGFLFALDPLTRRTDRVVLRHVHGADPDLPVSQSVIKAVLRDVQPQLLLELAGGGHVPSR